MTKEIEYSIVDYLKGGTQISLAIGIDFTASNGSPETKKSLHYYDKKHPDTLNDYQQAILAIGQVLLNYDHDKLVAKYYNRYLPMDLVLPLTIPIYQKRQATFSLALETLVDQRVSQWRVSSSSTRIAFGR